MQVGGGTDAQGVSREVHVCSSKSDVEESCRYLRGGMSSPRTFVKALTAEIALVLDEPEAELILIRHIQLCQVLKPKLGAPRVPLCLQRRCSL